ncbi:DUF4153 domain-containing protein [Pararhodonellum marinum]|uniref:DUF4153 domain-containing protein n=1 Tax=Pararhodonellum marinum TaxID=2755358 RepID=UPI0018902339|nr:DUF4153 domain-containing protein [Pararhodonellum marinum]
MKFKIKELYLNAGLVWRKYPFVLLFAFLGTALLILGIEVSEFKLEEIFSFRKEKLWDFPFYKLSMLSMLGISLSFGLTMLDEVKKTKWIQIFSIVLIIFYYFLFPNDLKQWSAFDTTLFIVIAILHHLLVSFLPFLFQANNELDFWSYNKSLFSNAAQTALFVGVLTGGLLLAIAAVETLFGLHFANSRPYLYVTLFSSIFGSCFVFLLFGLSGFQSLVHDREVPVVQQFFVQYILIPLLLVYGLILYAYGIKILLEWSLPQGWVSYMVIAYSVLGLVSLLLIYPLSKHTDKIWVRWFDRIFFYSLLPVLVLLFVAIFTRLFAYGITPNRYFVLIIAFWVGGISFFFIFFKSASIKVIPVSLFALGLFSIAFPFLNAFSTSIRSQKNQFLKILIENELLENDKINFKKPISHQLADQVSSTGVFLLNNGQSEFVEQFIHDTEIERREYNNRYAAWSFRQNFENILHDDQNQTLLEFVITRRDSENQSFTDVRDADFALLSERIYSTYKVELEAYYIQIDQVNLKHSNPKKMNFNLYANNGQFLESYDLIHYIKQQFEEKKQRPGQGVFIQADFSHSFALGSYDITVVFDEIRFTKYHFDKQTEQNQDWVFENVDFFPTYVVLVKKR